MSEELKIRGAAQAGNVFAYGAFDANIGGTISVRTPSGDVEGIVLDAEVIEDGDAVLVTVEVPDGTLPSPLLEGYSIAR